MPYIALRLERSPTEHVERTVVAAPDLEVDLTLLSETAGSLGILLHEFDQASNIVEDLTDDVGDNALLAELDEFVEEWKHKRQKLVESIEAVHSMATKSHTAYVKADNDLATAVTDAEHTTVTAGDGVR